MTDRVGFPKAAPMNWPRKVTLTLAEAFKVLNPGVLLPLLEWSIDFWFLEWTFLFSSVSFLILNFISLASPSTHSLTTQTSHATSQLKQKILASH
jgi:hypothetical protein